MKFSVVTVAFNAAHTIGDTLASVAAQTHEDVEHIVIDGGSTDGTLELVRQLGRAGTVLISEPDRGIYDAMNKGFALATGDWIGFLNADDTFIDGQVLSDLARLIASEAADVVYGDLEYVGQRSPHRRLRAWRSGAFRPAQLRLGWMPPHPTFYIRRALHKQCGGFDERYRIAADYDLMLRYLRLPELKVAYLPRVLVRMKTGGASNRSIRAMLRKSREDYVVLKRNKAGGLLALLCKNLRKLPQFITWTAR